MTADRLELYREHGETWAIARTGKQLVIRSRRPPRRATEKTQAYATPDKAKAKYEALIAAQRADGWFSLGDLPAALPLARHPKIEAALREDRDDPAPYLVYADWLSEQGSPLGELLVLAQRSPERALARAEQLLPNPRLVQVTWRHGLWRSVYFHNVVDWMNGSFDVLPLASAVFDSPLCAALEELRLGVVRWDYVDQPAILAAAGTRAWAKDLARLSLGDFAEDIDMNHHQVGDVGEVISTGFPSLAELRVRSGDRFELAGLSLPRLETLILETCALTRERARSIAAAKLPALTRLEVWFGDPERDATATIDDAAPLWDGKRFARLRHLGLRNSALCSDFVRLVPRSKLAAQLESLDFSKGTLDDEDAAALAAHASRFPALQRLNLEDTFVSPDAARHLAAAFRGVEVTIRPKRRYDWDPELRYVSVSE